MMYTRVISAEGEYAHTSPFQTFASANILHETILFVAALKIRIFRTLTSLFSMTRVQTLKRVDFRVFPHVFEESCLVGKGS